MKLVLSLSCALLIGCGLAQAQPVGGPALPRAPSGEPPGPPPEPFPSVPPGPPPGPPGYPFAPSLGIPPPPGYGPTMRVMSDTPEFCAQLLRHFARVRELQRYVPEDSVALADEGRQLCATGRIRAGIARLRLAFYGLQPNR